MREPLSALDRNFFILDSETSHQAIASLSVLEGAPDVHQLRETLRSAILRFPRIRRRLSTPDLLSSALRWEEDPGFDLDRHLLIHDITGARDFSTLLQAASAIFSAGFDFSHPLWGFHIIRSAHCSRSIVLFLIHHGFSDGGGGMELVHAMCEPRKRGDGPRDLRIRVSSLKQRPVRDSASWTGRMNFGASARRVLEDWGIRRDELPFHGKNSAARSIELLSLPLSRSKLIKDALNVSLNDVFLAYVAGALRRLSLIRGKIPGGRVFIPFNLRPRSARWDFGNYLSAVPISVYAELEDPLECIHRVHEATRELKEEGSFGAFGVLGKVASYIPRKLRRRLLISACRRANFICTNVPSSRQPLVMGGAPVVENYGCAALLPEQGIAVGFMSYSDQVCISLVSDPAILPRPREILDAIQAAEADLYRTVLSALPQDEQEKAASYGS